jgi:hypothetical protein
MLRPVRGRSDQGGGFRRCLRPGYRPGFVLLAVLLMATGVGAVLALASGTVVMAKAIAVAFLGVEVVWSVPVLQGLAEERRLRRELAKLQALGQQASAILALWAVADGQQVTASVSEHAESIADAEPVLLGLERAGLVTGEWIEAPGQPTRRRYQLTRAGHRLTTRTLRP